MADLHQIELALELPNDMKIHASMGSVFHGLLMDILGSEVAEWLHVQEHCRPFSQCVYYHRELNKPVWRISTLNQEAEEIILNTIYQLIGKEVYLKQKDTALWLSYKVQEKQCSYQDLMDKVFLDQAVVCGGSLEFITTASFKRDGYYVILPEMYLVFQSLIQRWNKFCSASIVSEDLEHQLGENCHITRYQLRSQKFSINGSNIHGFCGTMSVRFSGNDMTRRLMKLLLGYSCYAGVGMKTALGMGAVNYME